MRHPAGSSDANSTEFNESDFVNGLSSVMRSFLNSLRRQNDVFSQPTPLTLPPMQPPTVHSYPIPPMQWPTLTTYPPNTPLMPPLLFSPILPPELIHNSISSIFNSTPRLSHNFFTRPNHPPSNSLTINLRSTSLPRPGPSSRLRNRCNQCEEVFSTVRELSLHTRQIHTHFLCSFCHECFTQYTNLQRHSLIHLNQMPFLCKICNRGYRRMDHIKRHIQRIHPNADPRSNIINSIRGSECHRYINSLPFARNTEER
ncbi:unnamed protein product [Rodentolepis nana]|uniref:C2H2-type domain-containing protein n=1 Tax=Rodentolepis nana TaxID=102285 RepID=A0A0R3TSB6_RODNA|nr:unnamed protein product [Rodentolepis nana]